MHGLVLILLVVLAADEPTTSAPADTPRPATTRPSLQIDFRPVRVTDHREKDLSKLFPPRWKKPEVDWNRRRVWAIPAEDATTTRKGLTLSFKLRAASAKQQLTVLGLQVDEIVPDEGEWPGPCEGVWFEGIPIGDDDIEDQLKFIQRHRFDDSEYEDFVPESHVEVGLSRPPRPVRMIMSLRGKLKLEVATIREVAIDVDQPKHNELIKDPLLKSAGIKVKLLDPAKTERNEEGKINPRKHLAAEFSGKLANLVATHLAGPPDDEDEMAGMPLSVRRTSDSEESAFFGGTRTRVSHWETDQARPVGARLVVQIISERSEEEVPFYFEEIPLPR